MNYLFHGKHSTAILTHSIIVVIPWQANMLCFQIIASLRHLAGLWLIYLVDNCLVYELVKSVDDRSKDYWSPSCLWSTDSWIITQCLMLVKILLKCDSFRYFQFDIRLICRFICLSRMLKVDEQWKNCWANNGKRWELLATRRCWRAEIGRTLVQH